jgi:ribosomal protein S18 acetylase RimI-like enzyme
MKIRQLQLRDTRQVIDIWTSSFSRNFNNTLNPDYLNDTSSTTMVVCEGNTIIGVASIHIIYKLSRTLGLIEDVAVNKDHRGKGIGKSLVEKLIEIGKQKKCDKIVLNTSEKNSKFYEKIGFEKNEIQMVIRN